MPQRPLIVLGLLKAAYWRSGVLAAVIPGEATGLIRYRKKIMTLIIGKADDVGPMKSN